MPDSTGRVFDIAPGLLADGYTSIPNMVLRRTDLSANAKCLYALILDTCQYQRDEPSLEDFGQMLGGGVKTVRTAIRHLVEAGLLAVKRRGQGNPNTYTLLEPQTRPEGASRDALGDDLSMSLRLVKDLDPKGSPDIVQGIYDHWRQARGKTRSTYDRMSPQRRRKIQARLREFSVEDLMAAIDAVAKDPWPDRALHDDLTVIFRSQEQVDKFLEMRTVVNGKPQPSRGEQARGWVRSVGWRLETPDLVDELSRRGFSGDQRRVLLELAEELQRENTPGDPGGDGFVRFTDIIHPLEGI